MIAFSPIDLDRLLAQANELAPLPVTTVRLAEIVASPGCNLDDVAEVIRYDPALTLRVLRAANSALAAGQIPVGSVRDAAVRLGTAQVLSLAVAAGAFPVLNRRIAGYHLEAGSLWTHSVAAAVAIESLPSEGPVRVPPEAFTAALLHDVGKLVLGRFLKPAVTDLIEQAARDHLSAAEAERTVLQVDHAEVGGIIAEHWKLPPRVVSGIAHHHTPAEGFDPVCDFTHLADEMAKRLETERAGGTYVLAVQPDTLVRLGLTPESLEAACVGSAARFDALSHRYAIA